MLSAGEHWRSTWLPACWPIAVPPDSLLALRHWLMTYVAFARSTQRHLNAISSPGEWHAAAWAQAAHACHEQLKLLANVVQHRRQHFISPQRSALGAENSTDGQHQRHLSSPTQQQPHTAGPYPVWQQSWWSGYAPHVLPSRQHAQYNTHILACRGLATPLASSAGTERSNPGMSRCALPAASGHIRHRSSAAGRGGSGCWRCQTPLPAGAAFFCDSCGAIQPADADLSFYTVMGLCANRHCPLLLIANPSVVS